MRNRVNAISNSNLVGLLNRCSIGLRVRVGNALYNDVGVEWSGVVLVLCEGNSNCNG